MVAFFVGLCSLPSEFSEIVKKLSALGMLSFKNNCKSYEQFILLKAVAAPIITLTEGTRLPDCTEINLTKVVRESLPSTFIRGKVKMHYFDTEEVKASLDTCQGADLSFYLEWKCSPGS